MSKKVFIRTFGCQMNEYDSDKMVDVLAGSDDATKKGAAIAAANCMAA